MRARPMICGALLLCGPAAAEEDGGAVAEEDSAAEAAAGTPPATGESRTLGEVYFAFDSAELTEAASQELARIAEELRSSSATIVLGGFADPRGPYDYNVGLSARRADAVRGALVELGAEGERILLGVYGEDGPRLESYALERRVAIRTTGDPLHVILDRTLPDAVAVLWSEPVTVAELEGRPIPIATR